MTTRAHVGFRWIIRRDMPSVCFIEEQSSEFPWLEEEFIKCLRLRNNIGVVAEFGEDIVGYMIYGFHKKKLDILAFAVHPKYRRIGIGRSLVERLIGKLVAERRSRIVVQVRDSNLPAQLFFRSMGFFCTQVLKDYYFGCDDDAYVMEYSIGD